MIAALIVLAVVVIAAVVIISVGGKSDTKVSLDSGGVLTVNADDPYEIGLQSGPNLVTIDSQIKATIGGIEQHGQTLGNLSAKVKVLYFGDLRCSYCQAFTIFELPAFIASYVRTGKVSITYHSIQAATPSATTFQQQQVAAYAAGLQNKAWDFIERFYRQQGSERANYSNESFWRAIAGQIAGLNLPRWEADRANDAKLVAQLQTDASLGAQFGVTGTPALVFIGPKGKTVASLNLPSPTQSVSSQQASVASNEAALKTAYDAVS